MKKILYTFLSIITLASIAYAADRVIINPEQDGNIVIKVNDGGVIRDTMTIEGATSLVKLKTLTNAETDDALTITNLSGTQTAEYGAYAINGSAVGFNFQAGGTEVGDYSSAGAWTLGSSGGTQTHAANGQFAVNAATNADSILRLRENGTTKWQIFNESDDDTLRISGTSNPLIVSQAGALRVSGGFDTTGGAGLATGSVAGLITEEDSGSSCSITFTTGSANFDSTPTLNSCGWYKVGKIVFMRLGIAIDTTDAASFNFSFPGSSLPQVPATTVEIHGLCHRQLSEGSSGMRGNITGNSSGGGITIEGTSNTSNAGSWNCSFVYTSNT